MRQEHQSTHEDSDDAHTGRDIGTLLASTKRHRQSVWDLWLWSELCVLLTFQTEQNDCSLGGPCLPQGLVGTYERLQTFLRRLLDSRTGV